VISDESQGNVNFRISECLTKLRAKRLIVLCALFALQWSCLKMNLPDNLWRTETVFAFVILLHRLFLISVSTNIKRKSIFLQIFEWLSLTPQFSALSYWAWQFLNTEILQGSVGTQLRCDAIFNNDCYKFTSESSNCLLVQNFKNCHTQWLIVAILDLNISQGSVVTPLRCGGILKNDFIANLTNKSISANILKIG